MALPINPRLWAVQYVLSAVLAFLISVNLLFVVFSEGKLHDSLISLPRRKVALVLGTSSYLRSGQPSPFFDARIQAAAWIWQVGRAEYLLVSGDNQFESYNEPIRMKQALVDSGVPPDRIVLDYAGFSTLDSMVRAKKVFGQTEILVVSQEFQNQRAVFIGSFFGMKVTGYNARNPEGPMAWSMELREFLARPKAFLDVLFLDTQPRFLGDAVMIP
jgi:SanA protein